MLGKLSKLSSDVITGKRAVYSLYETSLPSQAVGATSKEVTVLQLFALLLDIISRLCSKGCSFAVAESSLNVADKLTTFLFEFVRSDGSRDSKNVRMKEDLPECVWTPTIKLVCVCMLLGPLWTVSVSRGGTDAFIHPIDQSELVRKLMKVLEKLKSIWDDKGLKGLKDVPAEELDIVVYRLFSMYSLLGLLLTLLKNSVTCKATAHSGLDSTRKLYIKELVGSFVQSGGSELLEFVSLSLNEVLSTGKKINSVCITLLKHKAAFVISMTSQLISALNKAKLAVTKSEDQKLHFSLDSVVSPIDPTRQEFRFSSGRSRSSQAFPVESSSDSDSDTQCTMNLGQHSCHSNKGKLDS